MRKVLMVARVFPPFHSVGHSIRVVKFIKYLPAEGWMPTVLTIDDRREYEFDRRQGSEALLEEVSAGVSIARTSPGEPSVEYLDRERAFGGPNRVTRGIVKLLGGARRWVFRNIVLPDWRMVWLPFALSRGRRLVRDGDIDVIFATCPPHSVTLIGALLKMITGKPLILDFRDDWIDTPAHLRHSRMRRWIERRMEAWVVGKADQVILVTVCSKKAFLVRYPTEPLDKFNLIPNGCDLAELSLLKSHIPAQPNQRFTILHAGSLNDSESWTRRPATMFHALHSIVKEYPWMADELTVAFTGRLPAGQAQLASDLGLSAVVRDLGFLSREELVRAMQGADMLLVINYEGFATLVPGKIYEYWAVGGPPLLLLSFPGAATRLVEQHQLGFAVDPSDVSGIREAILTAYHKSRAATPLRISTAGIDGYDRKTLTSKLARILSQVG